MSFKYFTFSSYYIFWNICFFYFKTFIIFMDEGVIVAGVAKVREKSAETKEQDPAAYEQSPLDDVSYEEDPDDEGNSSSDMEGDMDE